MEDRPETQPKAAARLQNLQGKVDEAARLISELRESNYALQSELAELKVKLHDPGASSLEEPVANHGPREEIELLRAERGRIRSTLESILERVDELES